MTMLIIQIVGLVAVLATAQAGPDYFTCFGWQYVVNPKQLTHFEAAQVCEDAGGHLAVFKNASAWRCTEFYLNYLKTDLALWLGLERVGLRPGDWKWLTGEVLGPNSFNNAGETVDNHQGQQYCAAIQPRSRGLVWDDRGCGEKLGSLCQIGAPRKDYNGSREALFWDPAVAPATAAPTAPVTAPPQNPATAPSQNGAGPSQSGFNYNPSSYYSYNNYDNDGDDYPARKKKDNSTFSGDLLAEQFEYDGPPIVAAEGWRVYCPNPIGWASTRTGDLPNACMDICLRTPTCRWITVDRIKSECWLLSKESDCAFEYHPDFVTMAPTFKEFDTKDGYFYNYGDIVAQGDFAARNPFAENMAGMCRKLCQVHPQCNTATVNKATGKCYLKNHPFSMFTSTGTTGNSNTISFIPK